MFKDVSFDRAREKANEIGDYLRRHGPFEPAILSAEEMEYTTKPQVIKRLKKKFKAL